MELIARIDDARRRLNVLEHPFYVRWERGELTGAELSRYAGQYRHAVVALADAAATASELAGAEHAEEERAHVALWDEFARCVGADCASEPLAETRRCADAWAGTTDPLEALAVLYAVEAGQPEVSRTKLAGLVSHYGLAEGTPAVEYFELHAERDHEHAADGRRLLARHASSTDEDRLVAAAEHALAGNLVLLDGVGA